jgi:putative spermidine/putrescine transport system ATP-binding protein
LREQMQIEIKHLHEALGMTVVYVTHDQGEALTMSDRVAILNDGVIQQIDTPHEVYENPSNAFVANFVGENNNLEGRIDSVDGEYRSIHLPSGETIVARAAWACEVGAPTTLSIRPERLEINPGGISLANQFKAVVREVIYFGDHNRIRLAMLGRDDFTARIPASAATGTLQPGQEVEVGWSAEHCRALERS